MNTKDPFSSRLLLCLSVLFISSCQKIHFEDFIHPDKTPKFCKIKKIVAPYILGPDTLVANFEYNRWDDPVTINLNNTRNGQTSFYFRYDKHKRLSDFIAFYNAPLPFINYESWTRYVWENNRVVRDTVWHLGFSPDGVNPDTSVDGTGTTAVGYYEYDQYDRITKITVFALVGDLKFMWHIETYIYNNAGNLAIHRSDFGGSIEERVFSDYDDKINPRRTNKVFMLADANYSVNNPLKADSYNQYGLPLSFSAGVFGKFIFLNRFYDLGNAAFTYECK